MKDTAVSQSGTLSVILYEDMEIWAARDRRFFLVSRSLSGRLDAENAIPRCKMTTFVKMDRYEMILERIRLTA